MNKASGWMSVDWETEKSHTCVVMIRYHDGRRRRYFIAETKEETTATWEMVEGAKFMDESFQFSYLLVVVIVSFRHKGRFICLGCFIWGRAHIHPSSTAYVLTARTSLGWRGRV